MVRWKCVGQEQCVTLPLSPGVSAECHGQQQGGMRLCESGGQQQGGCVFISESVCHQEDEVCISVYGG